MDYGYWVVLLGTFVEGETILSLAGALVHHGFFSLEGLFFTAFIASAASDQLFFFIGRKYGTTYLQNKSSRFMNVSGRVLRLLDRYETLFLIGFRFMYGLRNIAAFIVGAHRVDPVKFVLCNLIGAAFWVFMFIMLGYGAGAIFLKMLHRYFS